MNINNKKLKVLAEFGDRAHKSVLIDLTPEMLSKLDIDENGMIDTIDFIAACLSQVDEAQQDIPYSFEQLIFDKSIAVEGGTEDKGR